MATMAKLVVITQVVDPEHPALAATVPKIRALARSVDEVAVLAHRAVPGVLPGNCRVRTFGAPLRSGRGLRFEVALASELRGLRRGAVLAHMCPIYAVLAAPLVRPLGVPLLLWFTHWRRTRLLELAERASTAILTVAEGSFPLASSKVRAIGHGIDVAELPCQPPREPDGTIRLLALGRYSEAKGLDVVIRALARAEGARLDVYGPTLSDAERATRRALEALVERLALDARVGLHDAVPRTTLPELFARSDALVNNMRAGAPDKVVYEAGASCLPVLASNPVFADFLEPEQRFVRDDPEELAERIRALAALAPAERAALGRALRERVREGHSVESWARSVLEVAGLR